MATGWSTQAEKNAILDWWVARLLYCSMHTANPGATGANEATGGSPAYARIGLSWAAAAGGIVGSSTSPQFNLPAGTYTYLGFWSAVIGGVYRGKMLITTQTFGTQAVLPLGTINWDLNTLPDA